MARTASLSLPNQADGRLRPSWPRIAALLLALAGGAHAAPVPGLYDVSVEIADRSSAERARAVRAALQTVLVRVTGLATLARSPALDAALATPDRYALQFGLDERRTDGQTKTFLTVKFAEASVLRLVDEAGLPFWSSNRPTLVTWIVVDEGGKREIVGASSDHPFVSAFAERAAFRGLPVVLPALDLDDELGVAPGMVWSGMTDALAEASSRYGADGLVVVRLTADPRGFWQVRWQLRMLESEELFDWTAKAPDEAAVRIVDHTVDALAARYSVAAGGRQDLRVRVDGVVDFAQYSALLAYLGGLELVDAVRVEEVQARSVRLSIVTRTPWERFRDILELDGRLVAQPGVDTGFGEVPLQWQAPGGERP